MQEELNTVSEREANTECSALRYPAKLNLVGARYAAGCVAET